MDAGDPPLPSDAERNSARVERMKHLCDDLAAAQDDARKYHEAIEDSRRETDAFNSSLATPTTSASEVYPHIQRPPCPKCQSRRTIQAAEKHPKEKLYCPDCRHVWEIDTRPVRGRPAHSASDRKDRRGKLTPGLTRPTLVQRRRT